MQFFELPLTLRGLLVGGVLFIAFGLPCAVYFGFSHFPRGPVTASRGSYELHPSCWIAKHILREDRCAFCCDWVYRCSQYVCVEECLRPCRSKCCTASVEVLYPTNGTARVMIGRYLEPDDPDYLIACRSSLLQFAINSTHPCWVSTNSPGEVLLTDPDFSLVSSPLASRLLACWGLVGATIFAGWILLELSRLFHRRCLSGYADLG